MGFKKGYIPWNKGGSSWNKGRNGIYSNETIKKMSDAKKGKPSNWKGKSPTQETRLKMRLAKLGKPSLIKGRKHTKESREKMRISHTGVSAHWNKGEKSYNWKGGISKNPYPINFNSNLKLKIRKRDDFTCCLCGRTEREELEELNRVLSVNHIDFDKNNCSEKNLNTLCLRCNVKINREREHWTEHFNNK